MTARFDRLEPKQRGHGAWLWLKYFFAFALTTALLVALISQADGGVLLESWQRISPGFAALSVALFLGNLVVRGCRLAYLAKPDSEDFDKVSWIRLSALHQLLFTAMPSGLGDVSFPLLAARLGRCNPATATRILLTYRLQDLGTIFVLGGMALVLWSTHSGFELIVLPVCFIALFALLSKTSEITRYLGKLAQRLVELSGKTERSGLWGRILDFLQALGQEMDSPSPYRRQFYSAWMALLSWTLAAASLWSLFAMIDVCLSFAETLIVVAGMNLVGAIATFTVAGLGISEGGLAGILFLLGFALPEAATIALIVRPAALIGVLAACGIVECAYRTVRQEKVWTRPRAGTEEPRV